MEDSRGGDGGGGCSDDERNTNYCPKGHWRPAEDEKLRQLVRQYGPQNWNSIAEKLRGRSGKSCRLRWFNQLDPRINRRPFSEEEEERLLKAHRIHGNKWAFISRLFPGRTDNAVKNHWHVIMARKQRQHFTQRSENGLFINDVTNKQIFTTNHKSKPSHNIGKQIFQSECNTTNSRPVTFFKFDQNPNISSKLQNGCCLSQNRNLNSSLILRRDSCYRDKSNALWLRSCSRIVPFGYAQISGFDGDDGRVVHEGNGVLLGKEVRSSLSTTLVNSRGSSSNYQQEKVGNEAIRHKDSVPFIDFLGVGD